MFAIVLVATLQGVLNNIGWITVILHIFLTVTFGYFVLKGMHSAEER